MGEHWQVFGLVGGGALSRSGLVSVASRDPVVQSQCFLSIQETEVVPTHRCGAVPESHRVPSCDDDSG
jgi:hypothetical protein